jgi:hypothetical protein
VKNKHAVRCMFQKLQKDLQAKSECEHCFILEFKQSSAELVSPVTPEIKIKVVPNSIFSDAIYGQGTTTVNDQTKDRIFINIKLSEIFKVRTHNAIFTTNT